MDIFFVYYGTAGSSGLYMDDIYNALSKKYSIMMFVNYYYPFKMDNAKKIFFKYTEKHEDNIYLKYLKGNLRKLIRMFELVVGYIYIIFYLLKYKPKVLNYSLINMPLSQYFIKVIKKIFPKMKIILTCHDVEPYNSTDFINYEYIYKICDYLLVHNKASENILITKYKINSDKIKFHEFPLMNLSKLQQPLLSYKKSKKNFLFIGYIREEKGVDLLIEAWRNLKENKNVSLTIAGFLPDEVSVDFSVISQFRNVKLIIRRLSDKEYVELVSNSDFVILPYKQVGNSGVLSTIASLNKLIVASDLPVFKENRLIAKELLFRNGSSEDLSRIIKECSDFKEEKVFEYKEVQKKEIVDITEKFNKSISLVYDSILNQWN